jgi:hypothetical protein
MVINDGNRTAGIDWNRLPKALHVFCETGHLIKIQDQMSKIYGSTVEEFPMKTKMRFVKPIRFLCNQNTMTKYKILRKEQRIWCEQAHGRTVTGIDCLEVVAGKAGDQMTLLERILSFKMDPKGKPKSSRPLTRTNEEEDISLHSIRTLRKSHTNTSPDYTFSSKQASRKMIWPSTLSLKKSEEERI